MNKINWNKVGLRSNPFKIVPEKNSDDLIWAGFKENKKKFDSILENSLKNDDTNLILNLTRYGGGKTHASYFYSNPDNLPLTDEISKPLNLTVITPKKGDNSYWELYIKIVEEIGVNYISKCVKTLRENKPNTKESIRLLQNWAKSEDLGRILWLLGDEDDEISFGAEQLLLGSNLSVSLKNKLRVRRAIQSLSDISQVLSCLINILSVYNEEQKLNKPRKIFIWIDELESLVYYTSKQYRPFTQTIRELIDNTPTNLCLIMNFSFAEPSDTQNLEILIGEALLDRVNDQFIFEDASVNDALEYVKDLLNHFRISEYNHQPYYPFKEESLMLLLQNASGQTGLPILPRTINKWCKRTLEQLDINSIPLPIDESHIEEVKYDDRLDEF